MIGTPAMPVLERMRLHINTLYCLDAAQRLRCVNEIGEPPAPIFYMGRTNEGNLWHLRHDLPAALVEEIDILCRAEPVASDLSRPPQNRAAIRAAIAKHLPAQALDQALDEYRGPAYWMPKVEHRPSSRVVLITEANSKLLQSAFPWMIPLLGNGDNGDNGPVTATVEQGSAVSLCFCARRPAQATEAGVETLPAFRGRGYATATVAAWAAEVTRRGVIPLYSTSWENAASQEVARHLGMEIYGEDWSIQ
jgi:hypothetical protein